MISITDTNYSPKARSRFWKYAKYVGFFSPILLSGIFFAAFWREIAFFDSENFWFSLSASASALILAGTYYFAYRFFGENFYFFIFVSWIANAFYLIPDLNAKPLICQPAFFKYELSIYLLSLTSTALLLVALFTRSPNIQGTPTWKTVSRSTWITIVLATVLYLGYCYIQVPRLPTRKTIIAELTQLDGVKRVAIVGDRCDLESEVLPNSEHIALVKRMIPGTIVAFAVLLAVGSALKTRLQTENPGLKNKGLQAAFWTYGFLQFSYPFILSIGAQKRRWVLPLYLLAQLSKVGSAIFMVGIFQSSAVYRDLKRDETIRDAENEVKIKQAELRAEAERLQSERNFAELGRLASAIKHDVLTPLAAMSFDVNFLKRQLQHEPIVSDRLEKIRASMVRIDATVRVVDYFRGDKAYYARDAHMAKTSMLELAHRAVRLVKSEQEALKQENPKVRIKVTGRDLWVRANVPMLEQLVVNVIKNALEAIEAAKREKGLIQLNVATEDIEVSEYSRWVKLEIEDNGEGIPAENLDKLTTTFTTRADKKANSGIGLFIGQKILGIHDGLFRFDTKLNQGTKVTLLLPEWQALQKQHHDSGAGTATSKQGQVQMTQEPRAELEESASENARDKTSNITEEQHS